MRGNSASARPKLLAAQQALKTAPGEGAEGVDFGKCGDPAWKHRCHMIAMV